MTGVQTCALPIYKINIIQTKSNDVIKSFLSNWNFPDYIAYLNGQITNLNKVLTETKPWTLDLEKQVISIGNILIDFHSIMCLMLPIIPTKILELANYWGWDDKMKFLDILLEAQVDPEVEKVQRILLNRGYYLGHTGPNKDGIDGILGPLTKQAYQEYYKKPYPTADAQRLLKSHNIIVSEPPFPTHDNSVCVVFGGINYATPEWMMKQVPKDLLDKKTFAFAPYTSNIKSVEEQLLGKQIKSVVGFSAGGHKVWPLCGKYEFVGLIDPST